jgi:hypothetical protein
MNKKRFVRFRLTKHFLFTTTCCKFNTCSKFDATNLLNKFSYKKYCTKPSIKPMANIPTAIIIKILLDVRLGFS